MAKPSKECYRCNELTPLACSYCRKPACYDHSKRKRQEGLKGWLRVCDRCQIIYAAFLR